MTTKGELVCTKNLKLSDSAMYKGVKLPVKNELYSIRDLTTDRNKNIYVYLNEIQNNEFYMEGETLEPAFPISFFEVIPANFIQKLKILISKL